VIRGGVPSPAQQARAADARFKLREAIALHQQGRIAEAESRYREVLQQIPDQPDALHFLGVVEMQRGNHGRALQLLDRSLAVQPRNPATHYNRANLLREMGRSDEALGGYESALALNGQHPGALINRGAILGAQHRYAEALESYDRAIAVAPKDASTHCSRGRALTELNRQGEAVQSFNRALELSPGKLESLIGRAHALQRSGRFLDALADFDQAIDSDPGNADAHWGRAGVLMELRRFAEAVDSYDRARTLDPALIETLYGRASALIELERYEEAIADFRRLLSERPDYPYALGMLVHAQNMSCDWSDGSTAKELVQRVREGKKVASPFALLEVSDSAEAKQQCARIVMRDKFEPGRKALCSENTYRHERIRLAYLSADLRAHPVGQVIAPVIEAHDRARFEVTAISYGTDDRSSVRERLKRGFDRFIDAAVLSDLDIARGVRELETDILVDLTGLTASCRPGILTWRPAPVQVNYLGYAGTLGSRSIDYIVADRITVPEDQQSWYDEKIAWLPAPFLPVSSAPPDAPPCSRLDAGLPEEAFVFACFNASHKINAEMFTIWMRLLAQVDNSVLWFGRMNATAMANLGKQAAAQGVAPERIIFAERVAGVDQHLARLALADLFLDTVPYNAHSTAADALTAALPVLTCCGESFAARVASSLVTAAGLPEFVTTDLQEYESRALALARDPAELQSARNSLHSRPGDSDGIARFTRNLESAYHQMWLRTRQRLPAQSFTVDAASA
jgi:predicted O-linked N-acetylglucosamine transferase (SPINDLY family)